MAVLIVNIERFKFGQRPGLTRCYFCHLIWGDLILSLLNKVYINSSMIRRHSGGAIDD